MCGIVGQFRQTGPVDRERLATAVSRLAHRGPDDQGLHLAGSVGLGHTRLSIIDLGGGHQPLQAADGALTLIANGEIYNFLELRAELEGLGHRFRTHSDSEVILHAYRQFGDGFLDRLQGMFAFALHDAGHDRLILARDRLGIKPLFLAERPDGISFASEIKGLLPLLEAPPAIAARGLAEYLQNQFATGTGTLLQSIERVRPGEAVWVEAGRIARRQRYWSPLAVRPREIGYEDAARDFDRLMETVIVQHMRADVPFGLFLSGGVDSAVLLAQLSRYRAEPIRTYSVGFPGTALADELPAALAMSRRFGSRHREIRPDSRAIFETLPLTVWAADELMRDNANLPTSLLAQAAGEDLKVVFSGEGGDEVFAGYGRYRGSRWERLLKGWLAPGSGGFRTRGSFRGPWPGRLFRPPLLEQLAAARQPVVDAWRGTPPDWSDLQRMQAIDLAQALPDNLLVKADRMLMAWGVEGRVPFLDHRLVEFGLSLPDRLKISGRDGKHFLRRWAARDLPEDHLRGRKRGFHVPMGEWLDAGFLARLQALLPEHRLLDPWFRPEGVRTLIGHCHDTRQGPTLLWAIVQFALWRHFLEEGFARRPDARTHPLDLLEESR